MLQTLSILAKAPVKGKVKTRLAASVGKNNALELYRAMLLDTKRAADATGFDEWWWIEGPLEAFGGLLDGVRVSPQPPGELGARITAAFDGAFAGGSERAAVIGTDCPALGEKNLRALFAALDNCDCAVIPARDGGFCALALGGPPGELFRGVPWSSPLTLKSVEEKLRAAGKKTSLLPGLWDVDDLEGLETLKEEVSGGLIDAPATRAELARLFGGPF